MDDYPAEEMEDDTVRLPSSQGLERKRNMIGFWLLGLCNNFAYVIMLSAAKDILDTGSKNTTTSVCKEVIVDRECSPMSTGSVLLADIIPALVVKLTAPLYIQMIPFGTRHLLVVFLQSLSYILVSLGKNISTALIGVILASFASGLGEISYLTLGSYFKSDVISAWSSGTGGAGIIGALTYAFLTDNSLLHMSPSNALLTMLIVPVLFAITYWGILIIPGMVHRVNLLDPSSYFVSTKSFLSDGRLRNDSEGVSARRPLLDSNDYEDHDHPMKPFIFASLSMNEKWEVLKPLFRFMIPLLLVYFGEYFINQGMFELLVFDCSHGFGLNQDSQYRWYQVLYQLGVFVSRSSSSIISIPSNMLPLLAAAQLFNAVLFFSDAYSLFISHISIVFVAIIFEGLLGGAAYVNTFKAVHSTIPSNLREFSLGFVSISDTLGILFAGFAAIQAHNFICSK